MSGSWSIDVEAILFDLDGTLVDSRGSVERAWRRWAEGEHVAADTVIELMPGRTAASVIGTLKPELSPRMIASQSTQVMEWQVGDIDDVAAIAGAASLLGKLPPERWAVVTACSQRLARARLSTAGLPQPAVLISCELAPSKPDPGSYLLAAQQLGVSARRCLVVEDSAAGVASGQAAGMTVLALGAAAELRADDILHGSLEQLEATDAIPGSFLRVRYRSAGNNRPASRRTAGRR